MARKKNRVVYSTDGNKMEQIRQAAIAAQQPKQVRSLPPQQQMARIRRDKKGRGGKTVTLVCDLVLSAEDMKALSKTLKKKCGSGGAVKDDVIEIQGDKRDCVSAELSRQGIKNKLAGG